MNKPLVTIVIPLYNKADWIIPTLQSVLNQTYLNWECIIIDDGSTDQGVEKVRTFLATQKGTWRIFSQINQGQSVARNLGISLANGKYIAFLDADDVWFPVKLEYQVNYLEKNSSVGALYCSYVIFEEERTKLLRLVKFRNVGSMIQNWFQMSGFGGLLESTGLIRSSVLKEHGGFDLALSTSGGLELAIRLFLAENSMILPMVLVGYRLSANQWHEDVNLLKKDMRLLGEKYGDALGSKNKIMNLQESYFLLASIRSHEKMFIPFQILNEFIHGKFAILWMFGALIRRNLLALALGGLLKNKMYKELQKSQQNLIQF